MPSLTVKVAVYDAYGNFKYDDNSTTVSLAILYDNHSVGPCDDTQGGA